MKRILEFGYLSIFHFYLLLNFNSSVSSVTTWAYLTSWTSLSLFWDRVYNQGQRSMNEPNYQCFYSPNWEADPTLDRTVTKERRSPASCPAQAIDTVIITTSPIKGIMASTHWRKLWPMSIEKPDLMPTTLDTTIYIGML